MNSILLSIVTAKLLPLIIPPLVAAVTKFADDHINRKYIPLVLSVGGALVGAVASYFGMDVPDLANVGADAWTGALIGLASTGVHQLYTQLTAKPAEATSKP